VTCALFTKLWLGKLEFSTVAEFGDPH